MSQLSFDLKTINIRKYKPNPERYLIGQDSELRNAVEVAIRLGQPLLITGEPGTGKTQLAYKVAYELNKFNPDCQKEPLIFNAKTTSSANDLFYTYDAISHFHDANISRVVDSEADIDIKNYIKLQPLGKAIALTTALDDEARMLLPEDERESINSSVVLIDEIDKAPRDFPNDILSEIETFSFEIRESQNIKISKGEDAHIIVIMTSNSEKNLPEAFLRRCVFYHIPFPDKDQLIQIVQSHFGLDTPYSSDQLIDYFMQLRSVMRNKQPATSELLSWLQILEVKKFIVGNEIDLTNLDEKQRKTLRSSFSILAKTKDDLASIFSESEVLNIKLQ